MPERFAKNPRKVRAGYIGMEARWRGHVPVVLSLNGLTLAQREAVRDWVRILRTGNMEYGKEADDARVE